MAVCKRSKTTFNTAIGLAAIFAVMSVFAACGDDSGSGKGTEPAEVPDSDIIAATFDDLPVCSGKREGTTAYVKDEKSAYVCEAGDWNPDKGTDKDPKSAENTSSSTSQAGTKSSSSEDDAPEGFVREDISVTGVAQKGPFKFGSPLTLNELKKDLKPSGLVYKDEISSNKGDFVIPKVSLAYPYAKLEVRGLYRNEVTGEWSADSITLRALTDFSDKRTEVNINLLTHLEYDRVLYLVQEKGYSVYAAKKQAAQEIMTAFEFATAVTCSEDFAIFQNEGVSATTSAGNATLLAISALVMGNRSDVEIQNVIDNFIADIKTDGEWNDLQTKADMADWAYDFSYSTLKASVKSWNILDIPAYETYLDIYWNNVYGLGGCSVNRKDIVAPNSNKLSKNFNKYFICNGGQWVAATTYQKDTYEWTAGKTGECKKGNVTDTVYVYDGSKWVVSERETAVGLCGTKNAGVVSKFENVYYICRNNAWTEATVLEYDTYGLTCLTDGTIVNGEVVSDKKYVCDAGVFRNASDEEISLDNGCVSYTEGNEIRKQLSEVLDSIYHCSNGMWQGSIAAAEGYLHDTRDDKIYKTVTIGTQTWMAENLNFEYKVEKYSNSPDSISYGNYTNVDNGVTYGRYYTWAAAMDSAGVYSENSKGCGYYGRTNQTCTVVKTPARGICPEGWHIPDSTEWRTLYSEVGSSAYALMAKGYANWRGTDAYGFSVLPAGDYGDEFSGLGSRAVFWTSTAVEDSYCNTHAVKLKFDGTDYVFFIVSGQRTRVAVRCVKNSN